MLFFRKYLEQREKMEVSKRLKVAKEHLFGQVVLGPPGSGKTTYCAKVCQFYKEKLNRSCEVINLDPANENMEYQPAIDIMDLITVEDVMDNLSLGKHSCSWMPITMKGEFGF